MGRRYGFVVALLRLFSKAGRELIEQTIAASGATHVTTANSAIEITLVVDVAVLRLRYGGVTVSARRGNSAQDTWDEKVAARVATLIEEGVRQLKSSHDRFQVAEIILVGEGQRRNVLRIDRSWTTAANNEEDAIKVEPWVYEGSDGVIDRACKKVR
jgi:hypothetical protein